MSVPLMLEYEAVLNRQEHLASAGITSRDVSALLDAVASVSTRVRLSFRWRPLLGDANDEMVIETAINGGAHLLVTFNLRDFGTVSEEFGCRSVLPHRAVEMIRNRTE